MTATQKLRPPFKIHGGKWYLHQWVIDQFPDGYESMDYLEPFCGASSVMLNKQPGGLEVLGDVDVGVIRILRAIRDFPEEMASRLKATKYTEKTFREALEITEFDDEFEAAINEFIIRRMSRGGLKKAFAWSDRLRGGQPGDVNAWKSIIKALPDISARLKETVIVNKPADAVLYAFDDPNVLCYCDPPYLHETRESPNAYESEMSAADHVRLSEKLLRFHGKVVISGYPSDLYKHLYSGWRCVKRRIANHSSQAKKKPVKTEVLWMNF